MSAAATSWPPGSHPEAWRRSLTAAEPGVPWVTYYQPETGARVELSRATFDNWVAKAAGMLADECDVEAGSTVLLDLRPHWLLSVWAWATWALGATVLLPSAVGVPDVCITDEPESGCTAGTVLLSSRHPLGLPAGGGATGVVDALADIRGYPDVFSDPVPSAGRPLIADAESTVYADQALDDVLRAHPIERAALMLSSPADAEGLVRALLAPAFHGAALVLVDGGSPGDIEDIRAQERTDVDLN